MSDYTSFPRSSRLGGGVKTRCSDFKIGFSRRGVYLGVRFRKRIGEREGDLGCVLIRINLPVLPNGEFILENYIFVYQKLTGKLHFFYKVQNTLNEAYKFHF